MTARILLSLMILCAAGAAAGRAQEDYLEDSEISALRDAQEPDKRMILWMDFAQRRIGAEQQLRNAHHLQCRCQSGRVGTQRDVVMEASELVQLVVNRLLETDLKRIYLISPTVSADNREIKFEFHVSKEPDSKLANAPPSRSRRATKSSSPLTPAPKSSSTVKNS